MGHAPFVATDEILWFLEDGAKHKGQLKWIAERDSLPTPDFKKKTELIPLQCADLLAWCHNTYITTKGNCAARYKRALDRLVDVDNDWKIIDLSDPDRIPTVLGIPRRDPSLKYKHKIIKVDGRLREIVHYWPLKKGEPNLKRHSLVLPEPARLSNDEVLKAISEYDAWRSAPINGTVQ